MKNLNIEKKLLIIDFIYLLSCLVISLFLYIINIKFRRWLVILLSFVFFLILTISVILSIFKEYKSKKLTILKLIIYILLVILFQFILNNIKSLTLKDYPIEIEDKKYIAIFYKTDYIDAKYYEKIGPFFMGAKEKIVGEFGKAKSLGEDFNPYKKDNESPYYVKYTFYDELGKVIKTKSVKYKKDGTIDSHEDQTPNKEPSSNKSDMFLYPEDMKVLYEKKFGDIIYRFAHADYILGQRQIVVVLKSTDNGENFKIISNDITVSNEAEFIFLNENNAFVISTGYLDVQNNYSGLYVSTDGGKTLESAEFNYKADIISYIHIEGFPYYEDNILKLKCSIYKDEDTIFISKDNGLTWNLDKNYIKNN